MREDFLKMGDGYLRWVHEPGTFPAINHYVATESRTPYKAQTPKPKPCGCKEKKDAQR